MKSILAWHAGKKIFLSYRRNDSSDTAHRLYERLSAHFGAANVFLDRAHIEQGQLWRDELTRQVTAADLVIVLIGTKWLDELRAHTGGDDILRFEIASALDLNKQLIPVLIGATVMPDPALLPVEIRRLADFQALSIAADNIDAAMHELFGRIKPSVTLAFAWALANLFGWLLGLLGGLLSLNAGLNIGGQTLTISVPARLGSFLAFPCAGAFLGLLVGVPQWLVLRTWFYGVRRLVAIYVVLSVICFSFAGGGAMMGAEAGFGLVLLAMLILPLAFGVALWCLLHRELLYAGWWSVANIAAPFVGLLIAGANGAQARGMHDVTSKGLFETIMGILVKLIPIIAPSLLSGLLLVWLMRRSWVKRL